MQSQEVSCTGDCGHPDIYIGASGEKAEVEYAAVDRAGNIAICSYFVVVEGKFYYC